MTNSEDAKVDFLLEAASWQDSLLQSYRSLHITIQSILLATSAGLFVAIVSLQDVYGSLTSFAVMILMWFFQYFAAEKFKHIISKRGEDVNFWHREIIMAEQQLPAAQRFFTKFKVYQKLHREGSDYLQDMFLSTKKVTQKEIEILIEKGLGHTRHAVDEQIFARISFIWALFTLSGGIYSIYRIYNEIIRPLWPNLP